MATMVRSMSFGISNIVAILCFGCLCRFILAVGHVRTHEELPSLHLRAYHGLTETRALGHDADPSLQGNIVFRYTDNELDRFRRIFTETANATETLSFQLSIQACECDGVTCMTEVKKPGDTIKICLRSNFLDIAYVSQISLRLDNFTYQPIVNGTANAVTNVAMDGRLAIVTTMLVSAFFEDVNLTPLEVEGQVSFVPLVGGNRYLSMSDASAVNIPRSLVLQGKSVYIFIVFCVLIVVVAIAAAVGALIAKGYVCACLSRPGDEDEGIQKTYIHQTRA